MLDRGEIAVLDVGKTNVKLAVTDSAGRVLESLSHANDPCPGPPWRHHDLPALGTWLMESLAALSRRHPLARLVPVGHGSGGVLALEDPDAGGTGAALPMMDYEEACPPEIDAGYHARAGSFADRGSAVMMASTHAARQLWRMDCERPEEVAAARWFLNVAQYWAWWLTGVAASEATAMGAQSHLWNVPEARFSPIVAVEGWTRLMPPFRRAWEVLGPVRPELARRHGLARPIAVHVGAHDSSAHFYRYLAAGLTGFTLVSTGTWIVALSREAEVGRLDEARGMTINADVEGCPVGGALTMGGREFSAIAGPGWQGARAEPAVLARLVARGTMALPSFGSNAGQFPGSEGRGRIAGPPPRDQAERTALAVLAAACLTAACAEALAGGPRLILDGSFLAEPAYAPLVAAMRPGLTTEVSPDSGGVAAGAALLAGHEGRSTPVSVPLSPAAPLPGLDNLTPYYRAWQEATRANARGPHA